MVIIMENVPGDIKNRTAHLRSQPMTEECSKTLMKLVTNIKHERTAKSVIDTLVMADLTSIQFFNILRQDWTKANDRLCTLEESSLCQGTQVEELTLSRDGFVAIPDGKLMCTGCGGVVLEIPEFMTTTGMHALLNPSCPSFLRYREAGVVWRGKEIAEVPDLEDREIKEKIQTLLESVYVLYNSKYQEQEERENSIVGHEELLQGLEATEMAKAGWYVAKECGGPVMRCFCCGGERRNWQPDDCPYMLHLIQNVGCPYMHAILDEEQVRKILAGHQDELNPPGPWPIAVFNQFSKSLFIPENTTHAREQWDQKSNTIQKRNDQAKERLIEDWLVYQRIQKIEDQEPEEKRKKRGMTRTELLKRYQVNTCRIDINTRANAWLVLDANAPCYTPNWVREDNLFKKVGLISSYNRVATLQHGDWMLMDL